MTNAHRDLAAPELWTRSLERSRRRRELLPKARRELGRRKHVSAALATAVVAGPGAPLAAAQVSRADVSAAVAAESPANRAIEIREGGLPLQLGSQGELVAEVQRALHVSADGIFGVQTDAAVRSYQRAAGLEVDGIVGLATWGSLFKSHTASGASIGGSNIPLQARERVEKTVAQASQELAPQRQVERGADPSAPRAGTGRAGTTPGGTTRTETTTPTDTTTPTSTPAPTGGSCGTSTISSPVRGTVTSDFGPRGGRNHDGIDIAASMGTPIRAAACGTVSLAGQQSGYGNIICITHTSQFSTCYAHLSRFGVSSGTRVQQGQIIGYVGCTGSCTGPHLHFETRVGGTARDPKPFLGGMSIPGASASTSEATAGLASTSPATAATAVKSGTTTAAGNQATVSQSGSSTTTGGDSLESTTTGSPTTGIAISPTTETATPGSADFAGTAPADATVTGSTGTATVSDETLTASTETGATATSTVPATPAEDPAVAAPETVAAVEAPAATVAAPETVAAVVAPAAAPETTEVATAPKTTEVAAAPATDVTVTGTPGTAAASDASATGSIGTDTTATGGG